MNLHAIIDKKNDNFSARLRLEVVLRQQKSLLGDSAFWRALEEVIPKLLEDAEQITPTKRR